MAALEEGSNRGIIFHLLSSHEGVKRPLSKFGLFYPQKTKQNKKNF